MITTPTARATLGALLASAALAPGAFAGQPAGASATPFDDLPPQARAGECFARILIPAQYETVYQDVVIKDGFDRLSVHQPRFEERHETVLTKDPSVRYTVRQPRFETVTERVMVRPAHERLVVVPAQYETRNETVQIRPPRMAWKPGGAIAGAPTRVDPNTGTVYCLVEIPGETKTVTRQVLVQPETTRTETVPAQFAEFTRQVMVDPGGVDEAPVAGEHRQIAVHDAVAPASVAVEHVPAQSRRIARQELISDERYAWVSVLCDVNATPQTIRELQRALKERGYDAGAIDGVIGPQTTDAIRRFQADVGIPHGGYLSMETVEALRSGATAQARPQTRTMSRTMTHDPARARDGELLGGPEAGSWSVSTSTERREVRTTRTTTPVYAADTTAPVTVWTPGVIVRHDSDDTTVDVVTVTTIDDGRRLSWAGKP